MIDWNDIAKQVNANISWRVNPSLLTKHGNSQFHKTFLLGEPNNGVFIKTNHSTVLETFKAEAAGLTEIAKTKTILVPTVFCVSLSNDIAFIAMSACNFASHKCHSYRQFGQQLAQLHQHHNKLYGASNNNSIGTTAQHNDWNNNWIHFWKSQRLGPQLELAKINRAPIKLIDRGYRLCEQFFALFDEQPAASCLHGDLWSGNWGFDQAGQAVIFDPAHYYGDRETDIAMTKLFGCADPDFYSAYQDTYPLRPHYNVREIFYNIYHILNHYNLFGGTYDTQATHMINQVLSEIN